jgi:hypothetical protein
MMVLQPIERLKQGMNWVTHYPGNFVRLVGMVAILGSLGLILPTGCATRFMKSEPLSE